MVRTLGFHCCGRGSISGQGTETPARHVTQPKTRMQRPAQSISPGVLQRKAEGNRSISFPTPHTFPDPLTIGDDSPDSSLLSSLLSTVCCFSAGFLGD